MVTERVDGGGGTMLRCEICGQYYDSSRSYVCPYCSVKSPSLTEVMFGGPSSPGGNDHPITEAADMRAYSGGYVNSVGRGLGGRTQAADHIEPRSGNHTQIADFIEPRSVGHTQIANQPGAHAAGGFVPVVGWLIALNGPCKGTDYRLHTGYNYIGRERGDVCVHGDPAISKERDSCINYDQRGRVFYLTHEYGINQTLLNDRSVRKEAAELYAYDVITIGQTKLLFIPLCGNRFNW